MNYKNLNYGLKQRSAMNYKNLNYEIETLRCAPMKLAMNYKNRL